MMLRLYLIVHRYAVTSCIFLLVGSSSSSTIFLCAVLRILDVDLRDAVAAGHRLARAVGQRQDDEPVVLAHQRAFELRAVGHRDGGGIAGAGGAAAAAAPPPPNAALDPATHAFWSARGSGTSRRCLSGRRSPSGTSSRPRRSRSAPDSGVADEDVQLDVRSDCVRAGCPARPWWRERCGCIRSDGIRRGQRDRRRVPRSPRRSVRPAGRRARCPSAAGWRRSARRAGRGRGSWRSSPRRGTCRGR